MRRAEPPSATLAGVEGGDSKPVAMPVTAETRRAWRVRLGRVQDALTVAVLAILPLVFLKVLPGGVPPYGGDILVHVYPLLSLLAHGLHDGRPVLWNFYTAGGYPLAPYSALALYPPVVIALLALPPGGAIAALYVFYLAVFGIGMYALAGDLGLSRPARLLAAVTLAYGGFIAAHTYAGHLFELGALCPLPLAVLTLRRAILRRSVAYAAGCGALVGTMVLAAGVQFLPFGLALLPALVLWHTALAWARDRASYRLLWPIAALAIAGLVAAALGAVFLLPFMEILGATLRAAPVDVKTAAAQSLPGWRGLAMLVTPDAFGNAAAATYWPASRFGPYFHEIYAYAGLLPLLLAPLAVARRRAAWPYAAVAVVAVLVMLGGQTPLYPLLYHLPGASLLRAPARAGIALDFALAVLAGFGLDALCSGARCAWPRLLALLAPGTVVAVLVIAGLLVALRPGGAIPPVGHGLAVAATLRLALLLALALGASLAATREPRFALILPLLALLDLATANSALLRPDDPAAYYRPTPAVAATLRSNAPYRALALDGAVPPGLGMVTRRVYDVQDFAPLALAAYWRLSHPSLVQRAHGKNVATGRDVIADVNPIFFRLFGVRTIFSAHPLHDPALRLTGRVHSRTWSVPGGASWNVDRDAGVSLVYQDAAALPRTFVVTRATRVASAEAALAALRSGRADPARVVVLSPGGGRPGGLLQNAQLAWAQWLGTRDNGLTVQATVTKGGGYLVVDDGWFSGWAAAVDGRAAPVLRADYLLRAVRLSAGRHTVRMVYAPLGYLLGMVVTLVTALLLLLYTMYVVARRLPGTGRRPGLSQATPQTMPLT